MKTLITGGTGLFGRELLANLSDAVVSSRDPDGAARGLRGVPGVKWDPATSRRRSRRWGTPSTAARWLHPVEGRHEA